jgi:hypothetical protein
MLGMGMANTAITASAGDRAKLLGDFGGDLLSY